MTLLMICKTKEPVNSKELKGTQMNIIYYKPDQELCMKTKLKLLMKLDYSLVELCYIYNKMLKMNRTDSV